MDVLNISYAKIEDKLIMYIAIGMIHKEVLGTFAPYQMVGFLIKFEIIDLNIWSNLTFDSTKQLSESL
jgi:hypothetical protein